MGETIAEGAEQLLHDFCESGGRTYVEFVGFGCTGGFGAVLHDLIVINGR